MARKASSGSGSRKKAGLAKPPIDWSKPIVISSAYDRGEGYFVGTTKNGKFVAHDEEGRFYVFGVDGRGVAIASGGSAVATNPPPKILNIERWGYFLERSGHVTLDTFADKTEAEEARQVLLRNGFRVGPLNRYAGVILEN